MRVERGETVTTKLKVAKWYSKQASENAFSLTGGDVSVKGNFIDINPDRYKVRVTDNGLNSDPNSKQTIKIKLKSLGLFSTTGGVWVPGLTDRGQEVELKETENNSGQFVSANLLLVSTTTDNKFRARGIAPNSLNDPTLKVRLSDVVIATYRNAANQEVSGAAGVPATRKLAVGINQLLNNVGNRQYVKNADVALDLYYTREIFAQIGVQVDVSYQQNLRQSTTVLDGVRMDLDRDGLSVYEKEFASPVVIAKETRIMTGQWVNLTPAGVRGLDVISVYFPNFLTTDATAGRPFAEGVALYLLGTVMMNGPVAAPGAEAGPKAHGYVTLAHELGHFLLAGIVLHAPSTNAMQKVHLMVEGDSAVEANTVFDSRRLTSADEREILFWRGKGHKWFK